MEPSEMNLGEKAAGEREGDVKFCIGTDKQTSGFPALFYLIVVNWRECSFLTYEDISSLSPFRKTRTNPSVWRAAAAVAWEQVDEDFLSLRKAAIPDTNKKKAIHHLLHNTPQWILWLFHQSMRRKKREKERTEILSTTKLLRKKRQRKDVIGVPCSPANFHQEGQRRRMQGRRSIGRWIKSSFLQKVKEMSLISRGNIHDKK